MLSHTHSLSTTNLLFIWCNGSITTQAFFSFLLLVFKIEQIYKFFSFFFIVSSDFCFYWICLSEKLLNTIMLSLSFSLSLSLQIPTAYEFFSCVSNDGKNGNFCCKCSIGSTKYVVCQQKQQKNKLELLKLNFGRFLCHAAAVVVFAIAVGMSKIHGKN